MRILAIADDLSGAAEIAGIGVRHGLATRLTREPVMRLAEGLTVVDTDSRLLPSRQAAALHFVEAIDLHLRFVEAIDLKSVDLVYKKTDSAFRGPILPEVEALLDRVGKRCAVLVAQNPSRGRTIRGGVYRIGDLPLNETPFAHDPEYPARSANALDLLGRSDVYATRCLDVVDEFDETGITIGAASSDQDVRAWAERVSARVLPAGGADFFNALLETRGFAVTGAAAQGLPGGKALFVCGSASAYSRELADRAAREGIAVCPMLDDPSAWAESVTRSLRSSPAALMTIARPLDPSAGAPLRLQRMLAHSAAAVLERNAIDTLLLEGGATAAAVCAAMGWRTFEVVGEMASGVVQMRVAGLAKPMLVIKPGSYAWPETVWGAATSR